MDWTELITPQNVELGFIVVLLVASHLLRNKVVGVALRRKVIQLINQKKPLADIAIATAASYPDVSKVRMDILNKGIPGETNKKKAGRVLKAIFSGWLSGKIENI